MAYGFSVFWLPLTRAVGVTTLVVCPDSMGLLAIGFVCNLLVRPVEMVSTEAVGPAAASSPPPAGNDPAARVHPQILLRRQRGSSGESVGKIGSWIGFGMSPRGAYSHGSIAQGGTTYPTSASDSEAMKSGAYTLNGATSGTFANYN
jgi:hypothetical protein